MGALTRGKAGELRVPGHSVWHSLCLCFPTALGAGEVLQPVPHKAITSHAGVRRQAHRDRGARHPEPLLTMHPDARSPGCRLRLPCHRQLRRNLCCLHRRFLQLALNREPRSFKGDPFFSPDGQSKRKGCGKWSCSFPHALPQRTTAPSPPRRDEIWSKRSRQRGPFETVLPINNSWERSGESQGSQRRDL